MMSRVGCGGKAKVLFATIASGSGHVAAAKALMEALEAHYPGLAGQARCVVAAVVRHTCRLGIKAP